MRKIMMFGALVVCLVVLANGCDNDDERKSQIGNERPPENYVEQPVETKVVPASAPAKPVPAPAKVQPVAPVPVPKVEKKVCNITKDVRNEYCGVKVSAYQCKCAFHGEYCDKAGMSQDQAYQTTMQGFNAWVAGLNAACEVAQ